MEPENEQERSIREAMRGLNQEGSDQLNEQSGQEEYRVASNLPIIDHINLIEVPSGLPRESAEEFFRRARELGVYFHASSPAPESENSVRPDTLIGATSELTMMENMREYNRHIAEHLARLNEAMGLPSEPVPPLPQPIQQGILAQIEAQAEPTIFEPMTEQSIQQVMQQLRTMDLHTPGPARIIPDTYVRQVTSYSVATSNTVNVSNVTQVTPEGITQEALLREAAQMMEQEEAEENEENDEDEEEDGLLREGGDRDDVANRLRAIRASEDVADGINYASDSDKMYSKIPREMREPISNIVERVYPGMWDLTEKFLHIHFPELIIENEIGAAHPITDLYIRLAFNFGGRLFQTMRGTRTTKTLKEAQAGYTHSHTSGASNEFGHFCLGSTGIAKTFATLSKLSWYGNEQKWEEQFEGLLWQIDSYLRWESISGSPYHHIDAINYDREGGGVTGADKDEAYLRFLNYLKKSGWMPQLAFDVQSRAVEMVMDDEVEAVMLTCTKKFANRRADGTFEPMMGKIKQNAHVFEKQFKPFEFKGEKKTLTVIRPDKEEVVKEGKFAHRDIVNYIQNKFRNDLSKAWLSISFPSGEERSSRIARKRESNNNTRVLLSGIKTLPAD